MYESLSHITINKSGAFDSMRKAIVSKIIYPLSDTINGSTILKQFRFLQESQYWSSEQLRALQLAKLQRLVQHAYDMVPYYRKSFKQVNLLPSDIKSLQDVERIPILSKDDVRKYKNELTAVNMPKRDFGIGNTGGSTGLPIQLYRDRQTKSWSKAAILRFHDWLGISIADRIISIGGGSLGGILRKLSLRGMITKIRDNFEGRHFYQAFRLDKRMMREIDEFVKSKNIHTLRGYPSALHVLAKLTEGEETSFSAYISKCITTSERLYDFQRDAIEKSFVADVFDQYGCGEIYSIANQCEQKDLYHVNDEHVLLETKNIGFDRTELTPAILTNLDNYVMPFIRYDLGDIINTGNRKCHCGRGLSVVERIEGRTYDFLVSTDGRLLSGVFIPHLFRKSTGFDRFYAYQPDLYHLQIKIVPNERYREREMESLREHIKDFLGADVEVTFELVTEDELPKTRSAKLFFVKSDVAKDYI